MPSPWTFTIKPIARLLVEEMSGLIADPFAGKYSPAHEQNDINEECGSRDADHKDALEWLKGKRSDWYDMVLLDPPYSLRQVSEHYKKAGVKVTGWHTSSGWISTIKDEAARITKPGGKVICFGWNSNGLGKIRNFRLVRLLLVAHGGGKNDTICTVEVKEPCNKLFQN